MRRFPLLLVCADAALSGPATASNSLSFGDNVDPSLVSTITGDDTAHTPGNGRYHVLVFGGPDLSSKGSVYGGWRNQLADDVGHGSVVAGIAAGQSAGGKYIGVAPVVLASSANFGPNGEKFAPANDPWVLTGGASDSNDTLDTSDDTLASPA
jgi:hypothetical protein